jgi:hypothetical protein
VRGMMDPKESGARVAQWFWFFRVDQVGA